MAGGTISDLLRYADALPGALPESADKPEDFVNHKCCCLGEHYCCEDCAGTFFTIAACLGTISAYFIIFFVVGLPLEGHP